MKKVLLIIGSLLVTLALAAVIIPLIVDIDQYREELLAVANEQIEGELSIDQLGLSLWGRVEIDIQGTSVTLPNGERLIQVERSYLVIPFSDIFAGKPQVTFELKEPRIHIQRDATGRLNALDLVPSTSSEAASSDQTSATKSPDSSRGSSVDPESNPLAAILLAAQIDVSIEDAHLHFQDAGLALNQKLKGFNLELKDLGLQQPIQLKVWSDVATKLGDIAINGPLRIASTINPTFSGAAFQKAKIDLEVNLNEMTMEVPGALNKTDGDPLTIQLLAEASAVGIEVSKLRLEALGPVLEVTAKANWKEGLSYEAQATLAPFKPASLKDTIPPLGDLIHPDLQIELQTSVVTDEVRDLQLRMTTSGKDHLDLDAKVKGFATPQAEIKIHSTQLHLDKVLVLPEPEPQDETSASKDAESRPTSQPGGKPSPKGESQGEPAADFDAMIAELIKNPLIAESSLQLKTDIADFRYQNIVISSIDLGVNYKDLTAAVKPLKLKLFGGHIDTSLQLALDKQPPTYQVDLDVANLDFKKAIETFLDSFANTVAGSMTLQAKGEGKSLNPDAVLANLNLNGQFAVDNAALRTIDTRKMLDESVAKILSDVKGKVPNLSLGKVKSLKDVKGSYKRISSEFSLRAGALVAPNFHAEPFPDQGIDIKGNTVIHLTEDKLEAQWKLFDSFNRTGLIDIDVKQGPIEVEEVFSESGEPVYLPIEVGCKLSSPCYRYDSIPKHFIGTATANITRAVKGQAKQLVDKKLQEAKKKAAAEAAKVKAKARAEADKAKQKAKAEAEKRKKEAEKKAKEKAKEALKKKLPF